MAALAILQIILLPFHATNVVTCPTWRCTSNSPMVLSVFPEHVSYPAGPKGPRNQWHSRWTPRVASIPQEGALLANAGDTRLAGGAALATSTAIRGAGVGVYAVSATALLRGQAGRGAGVCLTHLTYGAGIETAATMPAVGVHVHTSPATNLEIGGPAAVCRAHAGNTTLGGLADHAAGAAVVRRGG